MVNQRQKKMVRTSSVKKKEERAPVSCPRMFHQGRDVTNLTSFNVLCEGGCQQVFQENAFPKVLGNSSNYGIYSAKYQCLKTFNYITCQEQKFSKKILIQFYMRATQTHYFQAIQSEKKVAHNYSKCKRQNILLIFRRWFQKYQNGFMRLK